MKIGTLVKCSRLVSCVSNGLGIVIARKGSTEWLVSFPKSGKQQIFNQRYLTRMD